jgi:hypothetical protein
MFLCGNILVAQNFRKHSGKGTRAIMVEHVPLESENICLEHGFCFLFQQKYLMLPFTNARGLLNLGTVMHGLSFKCN